VRFRDVGVARQLLHAAPDMSVRRAVLLIPVLAAACGERAPVEVDAAPPRPDAAPRGQGSETTAALVINEVAPRGDGADWIELANTSDQPIDLCGYILTDAADRLDHYLPLGGAWPGEVCTPRMLAAHAYLVIAADDTPLPAVGAAGAIDPEHAPFSLGIADSVHLLTSDGLVVDGVSFLYPPGPDAPAEVTLARDPDGRGVFWERAPTPDAANPVEAP
jgi:hypothetical protein